MTILRNKFLKIISVVLCVGILSGCEFTFFAPKETLRSPKATGYFEGVQQALENTAEEEIILKYPAKGEERSAFSVHDFDGDGTDEVVAFYQLRSQTGITRMNLLRYVDDEWISVQDFDALGTDIEKIGYSDFDGDGIDELVTGWTVSSSASNKAIVYGYQKGMLVQRASEDYSDFVICDIDNNSLEEIALLKIDKTAKTSRLVFYSMSSSAVTAMGAVNLDGNVLSYEPMVVASLSNGTPAIYIDGYKDTTTLITELVYYNGEKLIDPFIDSETNTNTATIRFARHLCTDVNSDGILDIPFTAPIAGYATGSGPSVERQYLIKWQSFDGKESKETQIVWYSNVLGFYFEFGDDWERNMSVALDNENSYAVFSLWNTNTNTKGDDVFRIRRFGAGEWEKNPLNYYSVIYANADYVWAVSLSEIGNSKFKLDLDSIKNRFHIITS